ncbi:MAG TPA: hypothetical protein PKY96_13775 [Flavobacteriales bacterium]|nr:hypothetical protein [Flavobacteriales bacterium]
MYSITQVEADIVFIEYQCKKNQVALIDGTGLSKLITDCRAAISNNTTGHINLWPLTVLYTLAESLKTLWLKEVDFKTQLKSMNSGSLAYGSKDGPQEHYFKDFEFEIFSAAQLVKDGVEVVLPQQTEGEDLIVNDIHVQCKHPSTVNQIDTLLRDFNSRLNDTKKYGVFGIAVEDCMNYPSDKEFSSVDEFHQVMDDVEMRVEKEQQKIFEDRLAASTRILGMYTMASFFVKIKGNAARMMRLSNAVFCFRHDRKEIKDADYKRAYRLLSTFNSSPSWLTIVDGKLVK